MSFSLNDIPFYTFLYPVILKLLLRLYLFIPKYTLLNITTKHITITGRALQQITCSALPSKSHLFSKTVLMSLQNDNLESHLTMRIRTQQKHVLSSPNKSRWDKNGIFSGYFSTAIKIQTIDCQ